MKGKLSTLCLILALGCLAQAQTQDLKPGPTGTWRWNTPNPDGRIPEITITLKLQGETLTGTVTRSAGGTTITNGAFKGDQVLFQTVSKRKDGKGTTTCTYRGKLSGDTIRGKLEIDARGKVLLSDWEAKREGARSHSSGRR